jgi:hypothetical protein
MILKRFTYLAFLICIYLSNISAQVPRIIAYQGVLTDTKGNPKPDGAYELTFTLYAQESGGDKVWQESKPVEVKSGIFSASLGDGTPLVVAFDKPYWLGIKIGSAAELSKRVRLSSAAYALGSAVADSAKKSAYSDSTRKAVKADSAGKAGVADRVNGSGNGVRSDTVTTRMVMAKDTNGVAIVSASGAGIRLNGIGNVGIGTTDPMGTLHVSGTGIYVNRNSQDAFLYFLSNGSGAKSAAIYGGEYNGLRFFTGVGTPERMRINLSGNVGIGTTTPTMKLDVEGSGESIRMGDGTNSLRLGQWDGANNRIESVGRPIFVTTYVGNINMGGAGATTLSVTQAGNVGIGTIDPQAKLHVNGRILLAASNAPATSKGAIGDKAGMIAWDASYFYVCTADHNGTADIWKRVVLPAGSW